jgi:integrase
MWPELGAADELHHQRPASVPVASPIRYALKAIDFRRITGRYPQQLSASAKDPYYVEEDVRNAVREARTDALRDAMDLAYLSGQRPADVLKMNKVDIRNDELHVRQNKNQHGIRIRLHGDGQPTELGACIDRLQARPVKAMSGALICTEQGQPLTAKMLRDRFEAARKAAAEKAEKARQNDLAKHIKAF